MTKIQVLGPGCPNCTKLAENAAQAARELGIEFEIEKVTEIDQMVALGVLLTPGLVVDGEVKSSGRVLNPADIKKMLG